MAEKIRHFLTISYAITVDQLPVQAKRMFEIIRQTINKKNPQIILGFPLSDNQLTQQVRRQFLLLKDQVPK